MGACVFDMQIGYDVDGSSIEQVVNRLGYVTKTRSVCQYDPEHIYVYT